MRTLPRTILLVEDSPGDVRLTREAFREAGEAVDLHVTPDGIEAMDFLRNQRRYKDAPRPDLILLDLNMPRMDGREVLVKIKQDDSLKLIPTVILTTSTAEEDLMMSYELQANAYLAKPVELGDFEPLVKSVGDFWLGLAMLPLQSPR